MTKYNPDSPINVRLERDLKFKLFIGNEDYISNLKKGEVIKVLSIEGTEYEIASPDGYIGFIDTEILDGNSTVSNP